MAEASRKVTDSLVVKEWRRHRWLAAFFGFGTVMCALTMTLLLFPETEFDLLWRLNPDARLAFQSLGSWSFVIMTIVGVACGVSSDWSVARNRLGRAIRIDHTVAQHRRRSR